MGNKKSVYSKAHDLAIAYLNKIQIMPGASVMFDIDDTLLYVNDKSLTPIEPIIDLLRECNRRGITVIIITARDSRFTPETMCQLAENDIYPKPVGLSCNEMYYDYLYLRKSPQDDDDHFKTRIKETFYQCGYNIIMSIGDNIIDIEGPYSGYGIKLPNKTDPRLFHINGKGVLEQVV
jgi:predicted secreted acid phosphatase